MAHITITTPATAHWHALIGRAEFSAHHLLPYGIEDYLVRLFMRFEREGSCGRTAFNKKDTAVMHDKLRQLGDQCLLLCGFYPEASEEYGVELDEFISMGAEAYSKLATIESNEDALIFEYLANHFRQVSALLQHIQSFSDDQVNKTEPTADYSGFSNYFNSTEQVPLSNSISHRILN